MNVVMKLANLPDGITQALQEMPLVLLMLDSLGRITELYGGELERLGLSASDLIGTLAVQNKKLPINRSIFRQAINGQKINNTFPVGEFIYEAHFAPLRDDHQNIIGVSVYATNVTSLIKLEEELDEERYKAVQNQNLISLSRMAGGIAHEINNPLAIVSGYVELIKMMVDSKAIDVEKVTKMANTLVESCGRIRNIVQGLVDFSTEQVDAPFAPVSLKEVISMSSDLVRSRYEVARASLTLPDIDPSLVVDCRRSDIAKILFNLLINSLESIQLSDQRWVSIHVVDEDTSVSISVTDSGTALAAHIREKVFEPFFTTKGNGHTGLGLSISKGLVENHRGQLVVSSSSKNACFTLSLPKKQR